jgi:two-component system, NarL family, response regulator NreC
MEKIRVFLVDDHTVVRQGLRRILESDDEIEIVGEAGDGRTAIDLVQKLRPHVVVMDVAMPELNGIEATRQIIKRVEGAKVLVLSMHGDDVYVRQALKAGARGYLLKDSEDLDLIKAVKAIRGGGSFFSPPVSKVVLSGYLGDKADGDAEDSVARLTDREREVLQLIAEGKTNKEVAHALSVSVNTVETHRKHIMEKLDLHNTAELVRFAIRTKIVH